MESDAGNVGVKMITQRTTDKNELFVCPYDPVHRISAKRFVYHIIKCRKNFPHLEMATCPFNARHIVQKPDLRHHIQKCPDRNLVELELSSLNADTNDEMPISNEDLDFGDDEDWDEEIASNANNHHAVVSFGTGYSEYMYPNAEKKGNSRREAIKRKKEQMRKILEEKEKEEKALRRPQYDDVDVKSKVFADSFTSMNPTPNADKIYKQGSASHPSGARPKARLAANFSMLPRSPADIGRGKHLREMQVSGERNIPSRNLEGRMMPRPPHHSVINGIKTLQLSAHAKEDHQGQFDPAEDTDWGLDDWDSSRNNRRKAQRCRMKN